VLWLRRIKKFGVFLIILIFFLGNCQPNNAKSTEIPDKNYLVSYAALSEDSKSNQTILVKKGDSGDKVVDIQKRLDVLGYDLPLSGYFGENTFMAVKDFQLENKLTPIGNIDATTFKELQKIKLLSLGPKKCPSTSSDIKNTKSKETFINKNSFLSYTKYFIWVNKSSFSVMVFEGKKNSWKLIKEFPCTIGKGGVYETPTGIFQIGNKGDYFVSGNVSAKYYSQIYGGVLFHTILYDKKGKKIVDSRMKMKLSHGCIRLEIPNAIYIHDKIPHGTTVFIN
jgi:peptidoglycan hydrolase-like protein with peptidoglycan-binding domain